MQLIHPIKIKIVEEYIKNKLKNHKVDWQKEDLLPNIESALLKKKSRKKWFFLIPLLITTLLSTHYLFQCNTNLKTNIVDQIEFKMHNTDYQAQVSIESQEESNDNSLLGKKSEYTKDNESNEKILIKTNHSIPSNGSNVKLVTKKEETILVSDKALDNDLELKFIEITESKYQNSPNHDTSRSTAKTSNTIFFPPTNNSETKLQTPLALLPTRASHLVHNSTLDINIKPTEKKEVINDESKKVSFFIEPNVSTGVLQRRFASSFPGYEKELEEQRIFGKPVLHYSISMEFGAFIKNKWSTQIGIEYQEMIESVEGDFRETNTHRYFMIPMNISRNFKFNKTKLYAKAGFTYALTHNFKGFSLTNNGVSKEDPFWIKKRIGYQLGIGSGFALSNNKELFLNAIFRKSPVLGLYDILEKWHLSYSIGLGFRIFL